MGNHERICHIKEIITNGPVHIAETYILYEPFLYAELYKVLRAPALSNGDRLSISTQLMDALSWIHAQGAMHRDLKPQNMGLRTLNPPEAVIFDFGHASFEPTSMDHYKGTIWYLAPEMLNLKYRRSTAPYDQAVDVWAMGLSLFELVTGTKWRGQKTLLDTRGRVLDYNMSRMESVHGELDSCRLTGAASVIQDMLEAEPRRRIRAPEAYQELLTHGQEALMESPNTKRLKRSYE
jgi:serine/threonine protein kinase